MGLPNFIPIGPYGVTTYSLFSRWRPWRRKSILPASVLVTHLFEKVKINLLRYRYSWLIFLKTIGRHIGILLGFALWSYTLLWDDALCNSTEFRWHCVHPDRSYWHLPKIKRSDGRYLEFI